MVSMTLFALRCMAAVVALCSLCCATEEADIQRALHSGIGFDDYMRRILHRVDEMSASFDADEEAAYARASLYWEMLLAESGVVVPEYNIHGLWCAPGVRLDPDSLSETRWTLIGPEPVPFEGPSDREDAISSVGTAVSKGHFVKYITSDHRLLDSEPDEDVLSESTVFIGIGEQALFVDMSTGSVKPIPMPSPSVDRVKPMMDAYEALLEPPSPTEPPTPEHARALEDIIELSAGLRRYKVVKRHYPSTWEALLEPVPPLYPDGLIPLDQIPLDPWGNPYRFAVDDDRNRRVRVWSIGPDGEDDQGLGDDVRLRRR